MDGMGNTQDEEEKMRHRISNKHPLTEKDRQRNKVINAVFDSRLARNPVQNFGMKGVSNDKEPVQQACS